MGFIFKEKKGLDPKSPMVFFWKDYSFLETLLVQKETIFWKKKDFSFRKDPFFRFKKKQWRFLKPVSWKEKIIFF